MKKLFLGILLVGISSPNMMNALTCSNVQRMYEIASREYREFGDNFEKMPKSAQDNINNVVDLLVLQMKKEGLEAILMGCESTALPNKYRIKIMRNNMKCFRQEKTKDVELPRMRREIADEADKLIDELEENFKTEVQNKNESENQ